MITKPDVTTTKITLELYSSIRELFQRAGRFFRVTHVDTVCDCEVEVGTFIVRGTRVTVKNGDPCITLETHVEEPGANEITSPGTEPIPGCQFESHG